MTEATPKKPSVKAEATTETKPVVKVDLTKPAIKEAMTQGLALLKEGKTKADAARHIYMAIKDEAKEVVIAAFMQGATLTEKGATTYWYNCKRKAAKKAA